MLLVHVLVLASPVRAAEEADAEEGERVEAAPAAEGEHAGAAPVAEVEQAGAAPVAEVEQADPEPWAGIEEITVTARRREEALQETPISITAFSEQGLFDRNIRDLTELTQFTPNLSFASGAAQLANAQVYIRGIGQAEGTINAEPRVGLYLDDVYQARPLGSIFDTFDLQRVEVLRGPQGTLYGKNAIGGAINIISNPPGPDYEARAELEFVNYDPIVSRMRLMGNMPVDVLGLGDKLFLRGTVVWEERRGYLYDTNLFEDFSSHNLVTGSARLRFLPIESLDLQVNYSGSYQPQKSKRGECEIEAKADAISQANREFNENKDPTEAFRSDFLQAVDSDSFTSQIGDFREACAASHGLLTSTNMPNLDEIETQKIHGFITWDTPELGAMGSLTVKSITAYQELVQNFNFDWDSTALTMLHSNIPDLGHGQFSQELRVHGDAWGGRIFWTAGAFYLSENSWGPRTTTVGLAPDVRNTWIGYQPIQGTIRESSDFQHRTAAGYLFGEIQPIDPLRVNAGFRYGWEKKTIHKARDIDVCMYFGGAGCVPLVPTGGVYRLFGEYEIPSQTYGAKSNSWTAPTGNLSATWDTSPATCISTPAISTASPAAASTTSAMRRTRPRTLSSRSISMASRSASRRPGGRTA
jgi:iron complex outermembrane receptor protein